MTQPNRLPTLFLSHGAPTLLIEDHPARDFLRTLGGLVPRPRAILLASAHWLTEEPAASTAKQPQTIHDFYGFPDELYRIHYRAPGAPDVARQAIELLRWSGLLATEDPGQGLDHGAWQPLVLAWPEADIPVFQLSIQPHRDPTFHAAVGRALAPLREEGVLVIGTGSATHNLRALRRDGSGHVEPWAKAFDDWLAERIEAADEAALLDYRARAPHAEHAHPTDEHLLPLYVALGAARGEAGQRIHASFSRGALSMAAFRFG
jgi:4,5-DOPA dioxygenase extradiol